ncbi:MAG: hypothetical protein P1U49_04780 [Minwuia sp.]|nr:hypothetical protein [Minwuia sp.]
MISTALAPLPATSNSAAAVGSAICGAFHLAGKLLNGVIVEGPFGIGLDRADVAENLAQEGVLSKGQVNSALLNNAELQQFADRELDFRRRVVCACQPVGSAVVGYLMSGRRQSSPQRR